jgi:hypothetical protein
MKFSNNHFNVSVSKKPQEVVLRMQFDKIKFSTRHFPNTLSFLKIHVPQVLKTKCFNPRNFTFRKEVVDTQMAHLFEHILLTFLCDAEIKLGAKSAKFRAVTQWNWKINPKGSFTVTITGKVRKKVLEMALIRAIGMTELLIKSHDVLHTAGVETIGQQPLMRPLPQESAIVTSH